MCSKHDDQDDNKIIIINEHIGIRQFLLVKIFHRQNFAPYGTHVIFLRTVGAHHVIGIQY